MTLKSFLKPFFIAALVMLSAPALAAQKQVTLKVQNMYCASCPYIVKQALSSLEGVEDVQVSFRQKTATVIYDDEKVSTAALTAATREYGYPSTIAAQE